MAEARVTIEKILLTHGHIDHCGSAGIFAEELGVPIEGPHEADIYWIERLAEDGARYGVSGRPFFHQPESQLALVGDVLFKGSIGRWDFPHGNHHDLITSIATRLWPMGDDTAFVPGHGPMSTFGHERQTNPFVGDAALAGDDLAERVELDRDPAVTQAGGRLDERPSGISVAIHAFAVWDPRCLGIARGGRRPGVGDRHDQVGGCRMLAGQLHPHPSPDLVQVAALHI